MESIPDLLFPEPAVRIRSRALGEALTFAFATGGSLSDLLAKTRVGASDYNQSCFARDLFLDDFIQQFSRVEIDGAPRELDVRYLTRTVSQPPRSLEAVQFRHEIFRELESAEWGRAVEQAWLRLDMLRKHFESPGFSQRVHPIHRRLDILRLIHGTVNDLAVRFAEARSPLRRIHEFATAVQSSSGWLDLCEVLDYEENLATVEMSVRISYDGQLRGFEIVRAAANRSNPLYQSAWGRLWSHVVAFLKGFHVREREVLGRLVEHVFEGVQEAVELCLQLLEDLEFYLLGRELRRRSEASGLRMCLPDLSGPHADGCTRFEALFNPFLLREPRPPVPCNLTVDANALVVVTGPNSGGKTRLLQAVGLAQLLAQGGCYVPAKTARLAWTEGLFVSLIQEVSAEQSEGRLGTELLRIRRMFEELSPRSLVILDELCSGTNPSEGEEIFELVVELLAKLQPQAFITTHFLQFAGRLARESDVTGLKFLQVDLDDRLRPTYQFIPGVASSSLAKQTAERLGVNREALLELVNEKLRLRAQRRAELLAAVGEEDSAASE